MSKHGGARPGAGRPAKFTDSQGNPLKTKNGVYPAILTDQDLERCARKKLEQQEQTEESE
jgi:hypothetical protein